MTIDQQAIEAWERSNRASASRIGRLILQFLPAGGVFLDIGANMGLCTEYVLRRTSARAFLFEPVPMYFERCQWRFTERTDVKIEQIALSDKADTATIWIGKRNLGWNTLEGDKRSNEMQPIEVKTLDFDAYAEEQEINRIDVIKIDVEGAEYRVLEGMRRTLSRLAHKPVIICEIGWGKTAHPNWGRETAAFEWLIANGFQRFNYDVTKTSDVIIYPAGYEKWRSWARWCQNLLVRPRSLSRK